MTCFFEYLTTKLGRQFRKARKRHPLSLSDIARSGERRVEMCSRKISSASHHVITDRNAKVTRFYSQISVLIYENMTAF